MLTPSGEWRLKVVLLMTILNIQPSACSEERQRADVAVRYRPADDLVFASEDLLWATSRASVTTCAAACLMDQMCLSFTITFTTGARTVECRGHSSQTPQGGVHRPGTRLYLLQSGHAPTPHPPLVTSQSPSTSTLTTPNVVITQAPSTLSLTTTVATTSTTAQWLNSTCGSSADCVESNAACFQGQCLCTPGYYYSLSSGACLDSCHSDDLQSQYISYQGYAFYGLNLPGYPVTLATESCPQHCTSSTTPCRSAKYMFSNQLCGITDKSRFDAPMDWDVDPDFVYFQRTCL